MPTVTASDPVKEEKRFLLREAAEGAGEGEDSAGDGDGDGDGEEGGREGEV